MTEDSSAEGPSFAMLCCANGAEQCVKEEIAAQGWRLAFSRPGFVTCKHDGAFDPPPGVFVRTASRSIGQLRGAEGAELLGGLIETLEGHGELPKPLGHLHVWPRDRLPIGKFEFEPGLDEVSKLVADEIYRVTSGTWVASSGPNQTAAKGDTVLDIVLVDPSHWFIGWHQATNLPSRWPGGVQPIDPQYEPISRAYYKAAEAIAWSEFEMRPGDTAVEVGSAPGGACGHLLELGMKVIGIDPAEMDPRIASHPRFTHHRARAGDLPRRTFRGAKWLLADSNVKPEKTLTTIRHIVTHRECTLEGLLLTMKLGTYNAATNIPRWIDQVREWQPQDVRVRQLATNRCEVCFAVRL